MKKAILWFFLTSLACSAYAQAVKTEFLAISADNSTHTYQTIDLESVVFNSPNDAQNPYMQVKFSNETEVGNIKTLIFQKQSITVGDAPSLEVKLFLFPNPVQDLLTVTGTHVGDDIVLYDLSGKIIGTANSEDGQTSIPVNHLAAGNYIVRVNSTAIHFTKK